MATLVFELIDREARPDWARLDIGVTPGISALQAAASRAGAPLGHDFCTISLSDLLTPWPVIERRIRAAAQGDFVIAVYNPVSQAQDRAASRHEGGPAGAPPARHAGHPGPQSRPPRRDHHRHDPGGARRRRRGHADAGHDRLVRDPRHRRAATAAPGSTHHAATPRSIWTTKPHDGSLHRRRSGCARPDHHPGPRPDRPLPGLPLRRLAGAAGSRGLCAGGRHGWSTPRR